ncbi:hypothetical protein J7E73_24150 [Paenibacillus albidus]|uniref:hypothetical protein n=1 Tax=Paenibacillus albidus TaxID=2041023 RepID=UPI001BE7BFD2|nr:hypothetical protein [Paenibacillus albidus]MBT2292169.1 hypothetical protein [Paenibacillus albidus]
MWKHKIMLLNPRYGRIGMVAMPYFVFVELLGPVIELLGILSVILGMLFQTVNLQISFALLLLMVIYGSFLSVGAVLFEQWCFGRYNKVTDLLRLFLYALSEAFWFRPLMTAWRFIGLIQGVRGKQHQWGDMVRGNVMNSKKPGA